ncbi:MAG TPA: AraC family transcriptional regulator [Candidatus Limnocylindria bacterium]|nr:AraC family transcriptional regulator [Candidatus Limnocylindria bacterium]
MKPKVSPLASQLVSNSQLFRDCAQALGEVTGQKVVLRPFDAAVAGRVNLLVKNWQCGLLEQASCECNSCAEVHSGVCEVSAKTSCACGPVIPVKAGREVVAMLQLSPVNSPTVGGGLNRRQAGVTLLGLLGESLSRLCNQLLIRQQNSEPVAIQKAKDFILKNLSTELSLRTIATAINVSPFYLSKLFRKSTGLTLTDFIARARIEQVKLLLMRPNVRVSEIAFLSGFQSLTQFNRVFLKLTGESPTEYRRKLPKT